MFELRETAREGLKQVDYDKLHDDLVNNGDLPHNSRLWENIKKNGKNGEPSGILKLFVDRIKEVSESLSNVEQKLKNNEFDRNLLHKTHTRFMNTMLTGQAIAQLNANTRN